MVRENSTSFFIWAGSILGRNITECAQCKEVGSIPAPSTYLDVHKSAGAVHPLSVADP